MKIINISVSSVIDEIDDAGLVTDSDKTELTSRAVLEVCEGGEIIRYTTEENGQKTDTEIYLLDKAVRVVRRGAIESDFYFEEKKSVSSLYKIPPYAFDAEIYTKRIRRNEIAGVREVTVIYDMTVGEAKKSVRMKISFSGGEI